MSDNKITINLETEKVVKEIPAYQIKINKIEIISITDNNIEKKIIAKTSGYPGEVLLWSGDEYDAIGNWTNDDVSKRVKELYS